MLLVLWHVIVRLRRDCVDVCVCVCVRAAHFPPVPQSFSSSDKDHLQNVMNKIKSKKSKQRKDLDRHLANHDGSIELGDWTTNSRKSKRK